MADPRRRSPQSSRRSRRDRRDSSREHLAFSNDTADMPASYYTKTNTNTNNTNMQSLSQSQSQSHAHATPQAMHHRHRDRAESDSSSSPGSSTASSLLDISRPYPETLRQGGVFTRFFRTPSERRRLRRRRSGTKKKARVLYFGNSSSSSVDSDMAYGTGYIRRKKSRDFSYRRSSYGAPSQAPSQAPTYTTHPPTNYPQPNYPQGHPQQSYVPLNEFSQIHSQTHGQSYKPAAEAVTAAGTVVGAAAEYYKADTKTHSNPATPRRSKTDEEIMALGRQFSDLAKRQNEEDLRVHGKTRPSRFDFATSKISDYRTTKRDSKQRGIGGSKSRHDSSDDSEWESASEDDYSEDSVDSKLAYGSVVEAAVRPAAAAAVVGAAMEYYDPRKHTDLPVYNRKNTVVDPRFFGPVNSLRDMIGTPTGFVADRRTVLSSHQQETRTGPRPESEAMGPMRMVHPVPTADPTRFDAERASIVASRQISTQRTRPSTVPLQQPTPRIPVSSKVYNTEKLEDEVGRRVDSPKRVDDVGRRISLSKPSRTRSDSNAKKTSRGRSDSTGLGDAVTAGIAAAVVGGIIAKNSKDDCKDVRKDRDPRDDRDEDKRDREKKADCRDDEKRDREKRSERSDKRDTDKGKGKEKDKDSKRRDKESRGKESRDKETRDKEKKSKRDSTSSKHDGEKERDSKRSSRQGDAEDKKTREITVDQDAKRLSSKHRVMDIREEREPEARRSEPYRAYRDQKSDSQDERREPFAPESAGSQPEFDPFRFQVDETGNFVTCATVGPVRRSWTPTVVTVDREPHFDDSPPGSPLPDGRLSRKDSFEIEQLAADYRRGSGDDYTRSMVAKAAHAVAPVSAAAMATGIVVEASRAKARDSDKYFKDAPRERSRSRSAKDAVQMEADRYYRESEIARKFAAEQIRSRSATPDKSVMEKYKDTERPEPIRIVTPPEYKHFGESRFDAPNADVRIDNKIYPHESHQFRATHLGLNAPLFKSRDPSAERDRPLLNLVYPTPSSSRNSTPATEHRDMKERTKERHHERKGSGVGSRVGSSKSREEDASKSDKKSSKGRNTETSKSDGTSSRRSTRDGDEISKAEASFSSQSRDRKDSASKPEAGPRRIRTKDIHYGDSTLEYIPTVVGPEGETIPVPQSAKSVTWGENEMTTYEVVTPFSELHRDEAELKHQSPDKSRPRLHKSSQWSKIPSAFTANASEPASDPEIIVTESPKQINSSEQRSHDWDFDAPPIPGPKPASPKPEQMPGGYADDIEFAATLAAGLKDTGFDPNMVIDNPTFHRRDSPPGSDELNGKGWYQKPMVESVSDMSAHEKPMHLPFDAGFVISEAEMSKEETQPEVISKKLPKPTSMVKKRAEELNRQLVAKTESAPPEPSTSIPAEEYAVPGSFEPTTVKDHTLRETSEALPTEEPELKLSKKEKRKRDKALKAAAEAVTLATKKEERKSSAKSEPLTAPDALREVENKTPEYVDRDETGETAPVDPLVNLESYQDVNPDAEWDTPKESNKKSKRDSTYGSPQRSVVQSETDWSEIAAPQSSKHTKADDEYESLKKSKKSKRDSPHDSQSPATQPDTEWERKSTRDVQLDDYHETPKKSKSKSKFDLTYDSPQRSAAEADWDTRSSRDVKPDEDYETPKKPKSKSKRDSTSYASPSRSRSGSVVSVDSFSKSKHSKRRSGTLDDFNDDRPDRGRHDLFDDRDASSVVSESRYDEDRRSRSKRDYRYDDDDAKSVRSVASSPGSSRKTKSKDVEKRSSGLFSSIFKSSSKEDDKKKKDSLKDNAGTLGAGVGLGAVGVVALSRLNATEAFSAQSKSSKEISDWTRDVEDCDPDVKARVIKPAIDPQYGDLLPLPPSEPGSPVIYSMDLPALPGSRPDTPPEEQQRRERISHARHRSIQETPIKSPSNTAIPIQLLRYGQRQGPASPGIFKSSPMSSPVTGGADSSLHAKGRRPTSWDSSREIKPFYLLEIARRGEPPINEDDLPELPPSEASPSEASVRGAESEAEGWDTAEEYAERGIDDTFYPAAPLRLDTALDSLNQGYDGPGSEETTPKAGHFPDLSLPPTFAQGPEHETRTLDEQDQEPAPVDAMTRDRSSYLLNSAPSSHKSSKTIDDDDLKQQLLALDATPSKHRGGIDALVESMTDLMSTEDHFSDATEELTDLPLYQPVDLEDNMAVKSNSTKIPTQKQAFDVATTAAAQQESTTAWDSTSVVEENHAQKANTSHTKISALEDAAFEEEAEISSSHEERVIQQSIEQTDAKPVNKLVEPTSMADEDSILGWNSMSAKEKKKAKKAAAKKNKALELAAITSADQPESSIRPDELAIDQPAAAGSLLTTIQPIAVDAVFADDKPTPIEEPVMMDSSSIEEPIATQEPTTIAQIVPAEPSTDSATASEEKQISGSMSGKERKKAKKAAKKNKSPKLATVVTADELDTSSRAVVAITGADVTNDLATPEQPNVAPTEPPTVSSTDYAIEAIAESTVEPTAGPTIEPTFELDIEPTVEPAVEHANKGFEDLIPGWSFMSAKQKKNPKKDFKKNKSSDLSLTAQLGHDKTSNSENLTTEQPPITQPLVRGQQAETPTECAEETLATSAANVPTELVIEPLNQVPTEISIERPAELLDEFPALKTDKKTKTKENASLVEAEHGENDTTQKIDEIERTQFNAPEEVAPTTQEVGSQETQETGADPISSVDMERVADLAAEPTLVHKEDLEDSQGTSKKAKRKKNKGKDVPSMDDKTARADKSLPEANSGAAHTPTAGIDKAPIVDYSHKSDVIAKPQSVATAVTAPETEAITEPEDVDDQILVVEPETPAAREHMVPWNWRNPRPAHGQILRHVLNLQNKTKSLPLDEPMPKQKNDNVAAPINEQAVSLNTEPIQSSSDAAIWTESGMDFVEPSKEEMIVQPHQDTGTGAEAQKSAAIEDEAAPAAETKTNPTNEAEETKASLAEFPQAAAKEEEEELAALEAKKVRRGKLNLKKERERYEYLQKRVLERAIATIAAEEDLDAAANATEAFACEAAVEDEELAALEAKKDKEGNLGLNKDHEEYEYLQKRCDERAQGAAVAVGPDNAPTIERNHALDVKLDVAGSEKGDHAVFEAEAFNEPDIASTSLSEAIQHVTLHDKTSVKDGLLLKPESISFESIISKPLFSQDDTIPKTTQGTSSLGDTQAIETVSSELDTVKDIVHDPEEPTSTEGSKKKKKKKKKKKEGVLASAPLEIPRSVETSPTLVTLAREDNAEVSLKQTKLAPEPESASQELPGNRASDDTQDAYVEHDEVENEQKQKLTDWDLPDDLLTKTVEPVATAISTEEGVTNNAPEKPDDPSETTVSADSGFSEAIAPTPLELAAEESTATSSKKSKKAKKRAAKEAAKDVSDSVPDVAQEAGPEPIDENLLETRKDISVESSKCFAGEGNIDQEPETDSKLSVEASDDLIGTKSEESCPPKSDLSINELKVESEVSKKGKKNDKKKKEKNTISGNLDEADNGGEAKAEPMCSPDATASVDKLVSPYTEGTASSGGFDELQGQSTTKESISEPLSGDPKNTKAVDGRIIDTPIDESSVNVHPLYASEPTTLPDEGGEVVLSATKSNKDKKKKKKQPAQEVSDTSADASAQDSGTATVFPDSSNPEDHETLNGDPNVEFGAGTVDDRSNDNTSGFVTPAAQPNTSPDIQRGGSSLQTSNNDHKKSDVKVTQSQTAQEPKTAPFSKLEPHTFQSDDADRTIEPTLVVPATSTDTEVVESVVSGGTVAAELLEAEPIIPLADDTPSPRSSKKAKKKKKKSKSVAFDVLDALPPADGPSQSGDAQEDLAPTPAHETQSSDHDASNPSKVLLPEEISTEELLSSSFVEHKPISESQQDASAAPVVPQAEQESEIEPLVLGKEIKRPAFQNHSKLETDAVGQAETIQTEKALHEESLGRSYQQVSESNETASEQPFPNVMAKAEESKEITPMSSIDKTKMKKAAKAAVLERHDKQEGSSNVDVTPKQLHLTKEAESSATLDAPIARIDPQSHISEIVVAADASADDAGGKEAAAREFEEIAAEEQELAALEKKKNKSKKGKLPAKSQERYKILKEKVLRRSLGQSAVEARESAIGSVEPQAEAAPEAEEALTSETNDVAALAPAKTLRDFNIVTSTSKNDQTEEKGELTPDLDLDLAAKSVVQPSEQLQSTKEIEVPARIHEPAILGQNQEQLRELRLEVSKVETQCKDILLAGSVDIGKSVDTSLSLNPSQKGLKKKNETEGPEQSVSILPFGGSESLSPQTEALTVAEASIDSRPPLASEEASALSEAQPAPLEAVPSSAAETPVYTKPVTQGTEDTEKTSRDDLSGGKTEQMKAKAIHSYPESIAKGFKDQEDVDSLGAIEKSVIKAGRESEVAKGSHTRVLESEESKEPAQCADPTPIEVITEPELSFVQDAIEQTIDAVSLTVPDQRQEEAASKSAPVELTEKLINEDAGSGLSKKTSKKKSLNLDGQASTNHVTASNEGHKATNTLQVANEAGSLSTSLDKLQVADIQSMTESETYVSESNPLKVKTPSDAAPTGPVETTQSSWTLGSSKENKKDDVASLEAEPVQREPEFIVHIRDAEPSPQEEIEGSEGPNAGPRDETAKVVDDFLMAGLSRKEIKKLKKAAKKRGLSDSTEMAAHFENTSLGQKARDPEFHAPNQQRSYSKLDSTIADALARAPEESASEPTAIEATTGILSQANTDVSGVSSYTDQAIADAIVRHVQAPEAGSEVSKTLPVLDTEQMFPAADQPNKPLPSDDQLTETASVNEQGNNADVLKSATSHGGAEASSHQVTPATSDLTQSTPSRKLSKKDKKKLKKQATVLEEEASPFAVDIKPTDDLVTRIIPSTEPVVATLDALATLDAATSQDLPFEMEDPLFLNKQTTKAESQDPPQEPLNLVSTEKLSNKKKKAQKLALAAASASTEPIQNMLQEFEQTSHPLLKTEVVIGEEKGTTKDVQADSVPEDTEISKAVETQAALHMTESAPAEDDEWTPPVKMKGKKGKKAKQDGGTAMSTAQVQPTPKSEPEPESKSAIYRREEAKASISEVEPLKSIGPMATPEVATDQTNPAMITVSAADSALVSGEAEELVALEKKKYKKGKLGKKDKQRYQVLKDKLSSTAPDSQPETHSGPPIFMESHSVSKPESQTDKIQVQDDETPSPPLVEDADGTPNPSETSPAHTHDSLSENNACSTKVDVPAATEARETQKYGEEGNCSPSDKKMGEEAGKLRKSRLAMSESQTDLTVEEGTVHKDLHTIVANITEESGAQQNVPFIGGGQVTITASNAPGETLMTSLNETLEPNIEDRPLIPKDMLLCNKPGLQPLISTHLGATTSSQLTQATTTGTGAPTEPTEMSPKEISDLSVKKKSKKEEKGQLAQTTSIEVPLAVSPISAEQASTAMQYEASKEASSQDVSKDTVQETRLEDSAASKSKKKNAKSREATVLDLDTKPTADLMVEIKRPEEHRIMTKQVDDEDVEGHFELNSTPAAAKAETNIVPKPIFSANKFPWAAVAADTLFEPTGSNVSESAMQTNPVESMVDAPQESAMSPKPERSFETEATAKSGPLAAADFTAIMESVTEQIIGKKRGKGEEKKTLDQRQSAEEDMFTNNDRCKGGNGKTIGKPYASSTPCTSLGGKKQDVEAALAQEMDEFWGGGNTSQEAENSKELPATTDEDDVKVTQSHITAETEDMAIPEISDHVNNAKNADKEASEQPTKGTITLSIPKGLGLSRPDEGEKETNTRQVARLDEIFEESPTLGQGETSLARSRSLGLLQRGPEVEEPVGGLLREDSQASALRGGFGSDYGGTRSSPSRSLPAVQEIPEAELEENREILRTPKIDSDKNSPANLPSHLQSNNGKNNAAQLPNTPGDNRSATGLSPFKTPVLREPAACGLTPEPEKKSTVDTQVAPVRLSHSRSRPSLRPSSSRRRLGEAAAESVLLRTSRSRDYGDLRAAASATKYADGSHRSVSDGSNIPPTAALPSADRGRDLRRSVSNSSLSFMSKHTPEPLRFLPEITGTNSDPTSSVDNLKRFSGDLRTLHQSNNSTPVANEGRVRAKDMTDVYDGFGEGRIGSPRSPTRPHSMRRRQSMQVLELESKVEQLMAENRLLIEARSHAEQNLSQRAATVLSDRDAEIEALKQSLHFLQNEVSRLTEVNDGLSSANAELASKDKSRYADLEVRHTETTRELNEARGAHNAVQQSLEDKDAEIADLRAQLESAKEQIREMQRHILASKAKDAEFLKVQDEDHFDHRCQQLCSHLQQWVLRFSKFSDLRACRLTSEINDEKTIDRLDNAVLDGSDVDHYLTDRVKRRDIFMSMTMNMIWEFVFTRYLFGMDREQRQKLKSLERMLTEVGPPHAVRQWRAVTLTLLSRRASFREQRDLDTEAVVQAIFQTLSKILPPPNNLETQIQSQLRKVLREAVDLSIEMRTQKAEYMMLPPLQPEYDSEGELAATVQFNASMMNERNGSGLSNEELEAEGSNVRCVLFPLVVKKGDDNGVGDEEIVVCPAQVLVAGDKRRLGASTEAGGSIGGRSHLSVVTGSMV